MRKQAIAYDVGGSGIRIRKDTRQARKTITPSSPGPERLEENLEHWKKVLS